MKILLFGSDGMLGKAIYKAFYPDFDIVSANRLACNISNLDAIEPFIFAHNPDVIINTAALIDINMCEKERDLAFRVNSLAVSRMAIASNMLSAKFIQISTDHYFVNDRRKKHSEDDEITLVNQYARTKLAGEHYALMAKDHLVLRTNIVGFKHDPHRQSFVEWAIGEIENNKPMNLFVDYFSSSIDVYNFSEILVSMIKQDLKGLYNVASREVTSKAEFIELLALGLNIKLNRPLYIEMNNNLSTQLIKRANSLGLDVNKIENSLGIEMPYMDNVIKRILQVYHGKI